MVPEFTKLGEKIAGDGKLSSRVVVAKVGGVVAGIGCMRAQTLFPGRLLHGGTAPPQDATAADQPL